MEPDLSPRLIDLALQPAFEVAGLEVRPATLEVLAGDRREQLEPRIMQVLVALAHRRGEVVSRDELIATCWGGRVVGDDSINRCIFRLRKLARSLGIGLEIATVPRVGFRLSETASAGVPKRDAKRFGAAAIIAVVLAVALGAGVLLWRSMPLPRVDRESRVSVQDFRVIGGDREAATLGATLTDDISGMLGEYADGVALAGAGDGPRVTPDLVVRGTITRENGAWRVRAYLEDARAKAILWSDQFERPIAQADQLRLQVAVAVTDIVGAAAEPRRQEGLRLDPVTLGLLLRGSQAMTSRTLVRLSPEDAIRAMEQVVARVPNLAAGHATLAANLAYSSGGPPSAQRTTLRRRARDEAERAIRMNAKAAGASFEALFFIARQEFPGDLARAEDVLVRGEAAAGGFAYTALRRCQFLLEVGRAREGLSHCDRALALRPLAAPIRFRHARTLAALGQQDMADKVMAQAVLYRPDHFPTRGTLFEMRAFTGDPDAALKIMRDPSGPQFLSAEQAAAFELFLLARKSGASADVDRAIQALRDLSPRTGPRYLIMGAAVLGRLDDAFAAADGLGPQQMLANVGPGILFEPATAPMRRDPRFWKVAARTGLLRYWRVRGVWPDFCTDPRFGVDCKTAAARAEVAR